VCVYVRARVCVSVFVQFKATLDIEISVVSKKETGKKLGKKPGKINTKNLKKSILKYATNI